MQQRSSLRLLGAVAGLAATVAACGGAGSGRLTDRGTGGTAEGFVASPAATPAATAPGSSGRPTDPSQDLTDASNLLRQLDDAIGQADSSLAADRDAAINMGE